MAHPLVCNAREVRVFLEASEADWAMEIAKYGAEGGGGSGGAAGGRSKEVLSGAVSWFKTVAHSATNLVAGKTDDSMENPEYLRVREYVNALEGHLTEAARQAGRLVRKENAVGTAMAEFALALEALGPYEDETLRDGLKLLAAKANTAQQLTRERMDQVAARFEGPLKDAARGIKCVQAAMAERSGVLSAWAVARNDLEAKRVKVNKLRATAGTPAGKVAEAEVEVQAAEEEVKRSKALYDEVCARMTEELNRWQKERAVEMAGILRDFAAAEASLSADSARLWNGLLAEMQQFTAAGGAASGSSA